MTRFVYVLPSGRFRWEVRVNAEDKEGWLVWHRPLFYRRKAHALIAGPSNSHRDRRRSPTPRQARPDTRPRQLRAGPRKERRLMSAELTEEERMTLGGPGSSWLNDDWDGLLADVESIVAARVRRALEDAADAVKDVRENGLPDGVMSAPYSEHFESWLRARAAAPDPREAKD